MTVTGFQVNGGSRTEIGSAQAIVTPTAASGQGLPSTTKVVRLGFSYSDTQGELFYAFTTWHRVSGASLYTIRVHLNGTDKTDTIFTVPDVDFAKGAPIMASNDGFPPIATVPLVGGVDWSYFPSSQDSKAGVFYNFGDGVVGLVGFHGATAEGVAAGQDGFTYTITAT